MSVGVQGSDGDGAALQGSGSGGAPAAAPALFPHPSWRALDALPLHAVVARQSRVALAVKRAVDVVLSAIGLALAAPLVLVLSAIVRLDSRGSPFYRQPRTGRGLRIFTLTKLRTMDAGGRVTRVGRLLRPTGLDELPQLWNVLKGDMSLVGPRPEEPHLVDRYEKEVPGYLARHLMCPGITGWAQVNGLRGRVSIAERLSYDLRYLRSWSLALDCQIFVLTVSAVWRDTRRALRG